MSYDIQCEDLARSFLDDLKRPYSQAALEALAQQIQTTIEDFLEYDPLLKQERTP